MRVITLLLVVILSGCAANASTKNPEKTGFVKISQGKAKGVVSWFTGAGEYCMVEVHNQPVTIAAEYDNGTCKGSAVSSAD